MEDEYPLEILRLVMKFEKSLDFVLAKRGAKRTAARAGLVDDYARTRDGEREMRERLKAEALNRMWKSDLKKRMDILDENIQINQDKTILLKDWARRHATEEEYSDLMRQLKDVVATSDPYDMGPELKECMDEMETAVDPEKAGVNQQKASPGLI